MSSSTTSANPATTISSALQNGSSQSGISLVAFLTALATGLILFGVQIGLFLLLRNKLARIFKPKTYLVPERERTVPPPGSPWGLIIALMKYKDREVIKKCGLDAYFFLRYLQTLLVIFVPIAVIIIPILVPINYVGGIGQKIVNVTGSGPDIRGLDTLSMSNVSDEHQQRLWAHLILALLVIIWVCLVVFVELRVYIKIRQDYLTSAEHRLRASANTVLVSSIPDKWLSEEALRGLFDVFPGGIRNVWLTRDFSTLLDKIHKREKIHQQLEAAESDLIRHAIKKQLQVHEAEEKKARKALKAKAMTKAERAEQDKAADDEARRRAEGGGGISVGNHEQVLHNVHDAIEEADKEGRKQGRARGQAKVRSDDSAIFTAIGGGLAKVGEGVARGVSAVSGAGQSIVGGARKVDGELEQTGGFEFIRAEASPAPLARELADRARQVDHIQQGGAGAKMSLASDSPTPTHRTDQHTRHNSQDSVFGREEASTFEPKPFVNTVRKLSKIDDMYVQEKTKWWEFWKPPTGFYASPVPQGMAGDEDRWKKARKTAWQHIKSMVLFLGDGEERVKYPRASAVAWHEVREEDAEWRKWVKPKDRPHHRLHFFDCTPTWVPGLPLVHRRVDTIYWCRGELARLNVEIAEDQQQAERYPIMKSAFIQFHHQVAAHMACQAVTHHLPKEMTPRVVEVSPNDVIWDNMAIKWWHGWLRTAIVSTVVLGMVILWGFAVTWTASLAQIDSLISKYHWLHFLAVNHAVYTTVKAVAGVLPAAVLSLLLVLVPIIFDALAGLQGAKTGSEKAETVQKFYFLFLFVEVFLVVAIASGVWTSLANLDQVTSQLTSTPTILATSLPKSANYFFSYMILQALSTSSGTLLQIGTLLVWYVLARLLDSTARDKWRRNTQLPDVTWGSLFPVYTNFACIALIYSVVAPIICIFAIITFSLLWFANRYSMIYIIRFKTDTGGVLYPRAINQTFTGLYVMELCLVGLFFLSNDENGNNVGYPKAIVMIVALLLTGLYQILINSMFSPLFRYLPITFEDEAVLRDEVFQRAQKRRLGLDDDAAATWTQADAGAADAKDVELHPLNNQVRRGGTGASTRLNPARGLVQAGTWAARGGKHIKQATFGRAEETFLQQATAYRKERRRKDLESQRAMGEALFGGFHDDIEDLTLAERDALVRKAFQHSALRARRPTLWIPRDNMGVSDDEIVHTRRFSEHIWISNEGTALDSKVRVVYGRNPPDFSEVDLINL